MALQARGIICMKINLTHFNLSLSRLLFSSLSLSCSRSFSLFFSYSFALSLSLFLSCSRSFSLFLSFSLTLSLSLSISVLSALSSSSPGFVHFIATCLFIKTDSCHFAQLPRQLPCIHF